MIDLKQFLIDHAPDYRPCGIRNIETINELKEQTGLNESALIEKLNNIPHVSTIGGSNVIASIQLDIGFPTR